jgi:hypothetical protein
MGITAYNFVKECWIMENGYGFGRLCSFASNSMSALSWRQKISRRTTFRISETQIYIQNAFFSVWRCVALVRSDVSEERIASVIRVKRIIELGTTLALTSNCRECYCRVMPCSFLGTYRRFGVTWYNVLWVWKQHTTLKSRQMSIGVQRLTSQDIAIVTGGADPESWLL